jgi:hypothetical protein
MQKLYEVKVLFINVLTLPSEQMFVFFLSSQSICTLNQYVPGVLDFEYLWV